jgi:hypothetical protein
MLFILYMLLLLIVIIDSMIFLYLKNLVQNCITKYCLIRTNDVITWPYNG